MYRIQSKRIGLLLAIIAVLAIGVILVATSGFIPQFATEYETHRATPGQPATTAAPQRAPDAEDDTRTIPDLMGKASMGDTVVNNYLRVRAISARASKSLGEHLKKISLINYVNSDVAVDQDNNLIDNHLYVEVGIEIENIADVPEDLYASNINLTLLRDGGLTPTDVSVTSTTDGVVGRDVFKIVLSPHEKQVVYFGYVITEEDFQRYKDSYYLISDVAGARDTAPEELTMIKLNIEEA